MIEPGVRLVSVGIHGAYAKAKGLDGLHVSYSPGNGLALKHGSDEEKKARNMLISVALELVAIALREPAERVVYLENRIHKTLSRLYEMQDDED